MKFKPGDKLRARHNPNLGLFSVIHVCDEYLMFEYLPDAARGLLPSDFELDIISKKRENFTKEIKKLTDKE